MRELTLQNIREIVYWTPVNSTDPDLVAFASRYRALHHEAASLPAQVAFAAMRKVVDAITHGARTCRQLRESVEREYERDAHLFSLVQGRVTAVDWGAKHSAVMSGSTR